jgi:hypothetical protein
LVCAAVSIVWVYADTLFYAALASVTLLMCVLLIIAGGATLHDLRKFSVKNREVLLQISLHTIIYGSMFLLALICLSVAVAGPAVNDSFGAFLGAQFILPAVAALVVRVAIAIHFRPKRREEDFSTLKEAKSKATAISRRSGVLSASTLGSTDAVEL